MESLFPGLQALSPEAVDSYFARLPATLRVEAVRLEEAAERQEEMKQQELQDAKLSKLNAHEEDKNAVSWHRCRGMLSPERCAECVCSCGCGPCGRRVPPVAGPKSTFECSIHRHSPHPTHRRQKCVVFPGMEWQLSVRGLLLTTATIPPSHLSTSPTSGITLFDRSQWLPTSRISPPRGQMTLRNWAHLPICTIWSHMTPLDRSFVPDVFLLALCLHGHNESRPS